MSSHFEIEIKTLLGEKEKALELKKKIEEKGAVLVGKNAQLNHYFTIKDINLFKEKLTPYITGPDREKFVKILTNGQKFSIRTREVDGLVYLVIKASIGSDSSSNGVSRMEFESEVEMSLDDLDKLLLSSGLDYQAKWSREREEYELGGMHICLDKNAGYGYLAEFEKLVTDASDVESTKESLLKTMKDFGVEELPQDRLERMFEFYNNNWQDYYGTEKVFNIE